MATWSVLLSGSFMPYDRQISVAIEAEYQRNPRPAEALVDIRGKKYRITFAAPMKQILESDPTKRRNVQRTAPPPAPAPVAAAASNDDPEVISLPDDDEHESVTAAAAASSTAAPSAVKRKRNDDAGGSSSNAIANLMTWNVAHLCPKGENAKKLPDTLPLLPIRPDFIALQEVHLDDAPRRSRAEALLGDAYSFFHHPGAMVALYVRRGSVLYTGGQLLPQFHWDGQGHVAVWQCAAGFIVNAYLPTPKTGLAELRQKLDEKVRPLVKSYGKQLIALVGDLNNTRGRNDTTKIFAGREYTSTRARFEEMLKEENLVDAFRERNGHDVVKYSSYQNQNEMVSARVDFILVPRTRGVTMCDVMDEKHKFVTERSTSTSANPQWKAMRSDHVPVVATVSL